jgi:hypothetical protein
MFGNKILTKMEQKHLRELKINTLYKFRNQIKFLKEEREKHPDRPYPCYDCIHIARKLGMWNEVVARNPDVQKIYHCWHYCLTCKQTFIHSQEQCDLHKNHKYLTFPMNKEEAVIKPESDN